MRPIRFWLKHKWHVDRGRLLAALLFVTLMFSAFKASYVRHDGHRLIGWGVLAIVTAALGGMQQARLVRTFAIIGSLTFSLLGLSLSSITLSDLISRLDANISGLVEIAYSPGAWLRHQEAVMQRARATVRSGQPLPAIRGSIDALPSIQSAIIAADLELPSTVHCPRLRHLQRLIQKNFDAWFVNRSPDHILFGLETIDDRLPALSEGSLWPDLLLHYQPTLLLGRFALLKRRAIPLAGLLSAPTRRLEHIGQRIHLDGDAAFIKIDVSGVWSARAASLLFKPPQVNLRLNSVRTEKLY